MDQSRRPKHVLVGAVVLAVLLTMAGCGLSDESTINTNGGKKKGGDGGSSTTAGDPSMRAPRSLCERISLEEVEGASRMKLDPGNPTEEYDMPECRYRRRGADVAVTVRLRPGGTKQDILEQIDDPEEVTGLGDYAVWSKDFGWVWALTDEGAFSAIVFNFELEDTQTRDAAVDILRTVMATTEVPDTTTTSTTSVEAPTGLCARFSLETVEEIADVAIEPGVPAVRDREGRTCEYREVTKGSVVSLELYDEFDMSVLDTDYVEVEIAGLKARTQDDLLLGYVETPEGVLRISISNFDLSPETYRAAATTLVEEFLASA